MSSYKRWIPSKGLITSMLTCMRDSTMRHINAKMLPGRLFLLLSTVSMEPGQETIWQLSPECMLNVGAGRPQWPLCHRYECNDCSFIWKNSENFPAECQLIYFECCASKLTFTIV